jgi:AraC-like DNA-binding protein
MLNQPLGVPKSLIGRIHLETFANPFWRQAIARHAHRFLEAHLVTKGSAVVVVGDQRIDLPTGSLLWLPPRCEHLTLETSPTLQRWCLCLRVGAVERALTREEAALLLSPGEGTRLVQLARVELLELARVFEDVKRQIGSGASVTNAGLAYALARAVQAFRQAAPSDEPTALHPAVARALSLMQGDGLLLSRDELAVRCRVSPTHLSRLFVRELGQSLREIRNRKRLARYQELLATGRCDSLTEAALEAGFGSYSQFHRVFKQVTGHSPSRLDGIL